MNNEIVPGIVNSSVVMRVLGCDSLKLSSIVKRIIRLTRAFGET